ncbi:PilZ domain-containing protein [Phyllobacterium leguminum]|nr:PilZ domain-containing protein [Phyllobacterium leguminum]
MTQYDVKRSNSEKRHSERRRTRLRSGKLVDIEGRFLIECQLYDITGSGARIRVANSLRVPERFWLFDDRYTHALLAQIVWRDGLDLGVSFRDDPATPPLSETRLAELAAKYYSL